MTGRLAGFHSGGSVKAADAWIDDPYAYDQAVKAVDTILEAMRPAGNVDPPTLKKSDPYIEAVFRELGSGLARGQLSSLAGQPMTREDRNQSKELREDLGRLAGRPGVTRYSEEDQ
jgi:hypothetical protein